MTYNLTIHSNFPLINCFIISLQLIVIISEVGGKLSWLLAWKIGWSGTMKILKSKPEIIIDLNAMD